MSARGATSGNTSARGATSGNLSARGAPSGNLSWRVETGRGTVLQKVYLARHGALRSALRALVVALARRKSGTSPLARWATERAVLAHWRERGFDVPRDLSGEHPGLCRPGVSVLEFVSGDVLQRLLADPRLPRAERDALLTRFAAQWSRRHRAALDTGDVLLVQEHGGFEHVMVAGGRMVTFDFEQVYRPGRAVQPLVTREIAGYLRTLKKRVADDVFVLDLRAIVAGYTDRALLRACVDSVFRNANPLRRLAFALDRSVWRRVVRGGRKYEAFALLDLLLAESG